MYYAPPHAAYAPDAPPPPPPFYYGAPCPGLLRASRAALRRAPPRPAHARGPRCVPSAGAQPPPRARPAGCVKRARWGAQHRIHEHFADGFPDLARRFVKVRASSDRRFEYDLGTRRFPSKRGPVFSRGVRPRDARAQAPRGHRRPPPQRARAARDAHGRPRGLALPPPLARGGGGGGGDGASDASSDAEDDDADAPRAPPSSSPAVSATGPARRRGRRRRGRGRGAAHLRARVAGVPPRRAATAAAQERIAVALVKILYAQEAPPAPRRQGRAGRRRRRAARRARRSSTSPATRRRRRPGATRRRPSTSPSTTADAPSGGGDTAETPVRRIDAQHDQAPANRGFDSP
ncbi:hypothetical protein JL720_2473 [Aureococcus anophagefferens]|nr:hypothetical protein JL720_2473 [Aureococcus anophagefferens]